MKKLVHSFLVCTIFLTSLHAQQNPDDAYKKDVAEVRIQLERLRDCNSDAAEMTLIAIYGLIVLDMQARFFYELKFQNATHNAFVLQFQKVKNHISRGGSLTDKISRDFNLINIGTRENAGFLETAEGKELHNRMKANAAELDKTTNAYYHDLNRTFEMIDNETQRIVDPIERSNVKQGLVSMKTKISNDPTTVTAYKYMDIFQDIKKEGFDKFIRKITREHYLKTGAVILFSNILAVMGDYARDSDLFGGVKFEGKHLKDAGQEELTEFSQHLMEIYGKTRALKMIENRFKNAKCN